MSQIDEIDSTSVLSAQVRDLQNLLERRIAEERETRQQTLIGLERWISDRLAERDASLARRLAERDAAPAMPAPTTAPVALVAIAPASPERPADDGSTTIGANSDLRTLSVRIDALEAQLSFIRARQDEFTQLLTTVREWVASPERSSAR